MDLNVLKTMMDEFRRSGYSECRLEADGVSLELKRTVRNSAAPDSSRTDRSTGTAEPAVQSGTGTETSGSEAALPAPASDENQEDASVVKASMAGTFYTSAKPGDPPYVTEGTRVWKGDTLGLLEAMKVISEIPSPVSGTVQTVLMEDGAFAEFDAPLFRIVQE